jgi:phosphatidylinositol glycan class B
MANETAKDAVSTSPDPTAEAPSRPVQPDAIASQLKDALAVLFAFRLVNAICVQTFFQPDEYFQALEPAWQLVFGEDSGAWMTWVCA